jgi:hypothetical protein
MNHPAGYPPRADVSPTALIVKLREEKGTLLSEPDPTPLCVKRIGSASTRGRIAKMTTRARARPMV